MSAEFYALRFEDREDAKEIHEEVVALGRDEPVSYRQLLGSHAADSIFKCLNLVGGDVDYSPGYMRWGEDIIPEDSSNRELLLYTANQEGTSYSKIGEDCGAI